MSHLLHFKREGERNKNAKIYKRDVFIATKIK